jgi:hypothetical protein
LATYLCRWFEGKDLGNFRFDKFSENYMDVIKGIAYRKFPALVGTQM